MTQLNESYDKIRASVDQINEKVNNIKLQIDAIDSEIDRTIPSKIKALRQQLSDIEEYEVRIEKIRVYAEKHLHTKNIIVETPRPINFNRLRNWSRKIDPDLVDDPYAQRVLILCKCNLLFLKNKRAEYQKALKTLESYDTSAFEQSRDALAKQLREMEEEYKALILSDEFKNFIAVLDAAHSKWRYDILPSGYTKKDKDPELFVMGAGAEELPFPESLRPEIAVMLKSYYSESTGCVWTPLEMDAATAGTFLVSYSNSIDPKEINRGLQNFLFRTMNDSRTGGQKICVCDAFHYNTSVLGPLKKLEDTSVLYKIPRNPEQIIQQLKEIMAGFSDYDDLLGTYDSVIDYNAEYDNKEKLTRTTLVLVGYPSAYPGEAVDIVKRIMVNAERYGVTVVAVDTYNEKDGVSYSDVPDHIANRAWRIVMSQKNVATIQKGIDGAERGFLWYMLPKNLEDSYVEDIKKLTKAKTGQNNVYPKRINMKNPEYQRGRKDLSLPIAVDKRDDIHEISFTNENFAHFLMGASGSGKSTLLHNIITGIIHRYHPDDVELWLADFKMSEFAQYIDPLPPHIKYILLDESQELVYDLIDKLTEKMMERQKYFMQHREMKKVENVPTDVYMPVIFVILDEFSIMSQAVAEDEAYKLKLQNLLAKGRALGIKFIFSSQTFIKGIAGLTPTAKEQIQTRVAMKNSFEEINETLELSTNTKTDQVRNWMDALPPHYILMKYRDGETMNVKRLNVMYFDGKAETAMEPQRQLIRAINNRMKPVAIEKYGLGPDTYVDKQPVIVDGNAFKKYDSEQFMDSVAAYKEMNGNDLIGDEVYMTFGTPRLMSNSKLTILSSETRENLLLVARTSEQALAMSIILSTIKSAKLQNKEVQVWAYGRTRIYKSYRNLFEESGAEIIEGIDDICDAIRDVKASIKRREVRERMIILVGMDRICADFELIDGTDENGGALFGTDSVLAERDQLIKNGATASTLDEEQRKLLDEWMTISIDKMEELEEQGKSDEEIDAILDEMEEEFFSSRQLGSADADMADVEAESSSPVETVIGDAVEPAAETVAEPEKGAYSALADFVYLMMQGSRMGTHFMLLLNSLADIKQCGVNADLFRYKMTFQISEDDSRDLFGSKIASTIPEHICQYDDTYERYSFRPYLHEGLTWDGWGVDSDGDIINPMF